MFLFLRSLFKTEAPPGRKRPPLVIVTAVLQIAFGTLSVCGPIAYFSGVQRLMIWFQGSLQSSIPRPPGQPNIGPEKVDALIHRLAPWIDTYNNVINGVSLLLCLLMIFGGFGLLRMERSGWKMTVVYALASLTLHLFIAIFAFAYMGDMMRGMMTGMFEDFPPPRPGQPDIKKVFEDVFASFGVGVDIFLGVASLLPMIYPGLILIFMLVPSVRRSFAPVMDVIADQPPTRTAEIRPGE